VTTAAESIRPAAITRRGVRRFGARWSAAAWGSIVVGALFVAATCWWLSQNHGVPVYDAALHLSFAIEAYEALGSGHLLRAFTGSAPYPPLTHLVGALGIFLGGVDVAPPIIAANLVFVPLLALGCYKVGRLAFGPLAGLLAVVFALGSPLIIEEFHEFMLDAPEAAMVAVAVWAILATERFSRPGVCAVAGVAVGLGMLSKETFVFFVAGVALVTAVRGGRRAWRGIVVFAAVALIIALPWYLYELSTIHSLAGEALGPSNAGLPGIAPPRLSVANLEWYFWSSVNLQFLLPLFAFFAVGLAWALAGFARRRPVSRFAPELVLGAFTSWVALTETFVHDPRYGMPMVVYLAVLGAGWISRLPSVARAVMATTLVVIAVANLLGVGFGVGRTIGIGPLTAGFPQPGRFTLDATNGLWLGAPIRQGDVLGLLRALHRDGVREVRLYSGQESEIEFSIPGIIALARIAELGIASESVDPVRASRRYAFLHHEPPEAGLPTPCTTLQNGMGVWVSLGGSRRPLRWSYCPLRSG
jgi:4-amino-4-deoxy-L-arabinose transferase-like glycosyltransferase